jgi:hypothetical protein
MKASAEDFFVKESGELVFSRSLRRLTKQLK